MEVISFKSLFCRAILNFVPLTPYLALLFSHQATIIHVDVRESKFKFTWRKFACKFATWF